jgi:hypothetical protein
MRAVATFHLARFVYHKPAYGESAEDEMGRNKFVLHIYRDCGQSSGTAGSAAAINTLSYEDPDN